MRFFCVVNFWRLASLLLEQRSAYVGAMHVAVCTAVANKPPSVVWVKSKSCAKPIGDFCFQIMAVIDTTSAVWITHIIINATSEFQPE